MAPPIRIRVRRSFYPALLLGLAACGPPSGNEAATPAPSLSTPANASMTPVDKAPAPATGTDIADPLAFVRKIYAGYAPGAGDPPPLIADASLSPRLRALFAKDRAGADGVGNLDFDYWVAGQDYDLSPVVLAVEPGTAEGRRTIIARFRNMGAPIVNRFDFVRAGDRWLLDDVRNQAMPASESSGWILSTILAGPPGG